MDPFLEMLAEDNSRVSYRPRFAKATGTVTSALLLQQIFHWWKSSGFKPFYKFKEPCKHRLYKPGDSWLEELGFSRREFDSALNSIAQKVNAETPRDPEKLVWYWIDSDRVTHYELNYDGFAKFVKSLYVTAESATRKSAKAPLLITEITPETTTNIPFAEAEPSAPEPVDVLLARMKQALAKDRATKIRLHYPSLEELEQCIEGYWASWSDFKTQTLPLGNKSKEISAASAASQLALLFEMQNRYQLSAEAMRHGFTQAINKGADNINFVISCARRYKP